MCSLSPLSASGTTRSSPGDNSRVVGKQEVDSLIFARDKATEASETLGYSDPRITLRPTFDLHTLGPYTPHNCPFGAS